MLVSRLRRDGKLISRDLAVEFGVSEDSVRRDLRDLAAAGLCQRVHGGALPASPAVDTHEHRSWLAPESKHPRAGLTVGDPDEAAMRRILVGRAADTYVVASIEMIGTVAPYTTVELPAIAGLVTDAPADHPTVRQLRHQNVNVIQA